MLLASFLVVDQCIRFFPMAEACTAATQESRLDLVTVVTFTTMIITSLLNTILTNPYERRVSVFFSVFVHIMIVITYLQVYYQLGSGAVVWKTSYGSTFRPARINLWLHSSMTQILSFAASPRAVDRYGVPHVLRRVQDVLVMFIFGFLATASPPALLTEMAGPGAETAFTAVALLAASPPLYRSIRFLSDALPLCLRLPEASSATDSQRSAIRRPLLGPAGSLLLPQRLLPSHASSRIAHISTDPS